LSIDLARLGNNLSGQYKRSVGMALQIGIGNVGIAIASNIYRTQDSPRYILGREFHSVVPFFGAIMLVYKVHHNLPVSNIPPPFLLYNVHFLRR
jgi:hypothetical protein